MVLLGFVCVCVCFDWCVLLDLGFCYCNGILISEIIASLYRQSMPYVLSFYFMEKC